MFDLINLVPELFGAEKCCIPLYGFIHLSRNSREVVPFHRPEMHGIDLIVIMTHKVPIYGWPRLQEEVNLKHGRIMNQHVMCQNVAA